MAIYHFHSKAITRSETGGKTAVAAAAYRNAERYRGVDDITVNYTRKQSNGNELIYPRYVENRISAEELWRSADAAELKLDGSFKKVSRSAREFEFSLMQELTPKQNKAAAREFARIFSEKYGVACNIAFHQLENKNPHCHMMFTVRKIEADGTLSDKIREIDNINMMLQARKKWAEIANKHLMFAGYDITISEKSYNDQGIQHEPTKHINNKKLKRAERKGIELPETIRNAALMRMRSSNDDQYQEQDDVKKNGSDDVVDDSAQQSVAVSMHVEAFEEFQPAPAPSPAQKLRYEGLNGQELAQRAAEDVALLKMKQKINDDLRAIDEHYQRIKKLHQEIEDSKNIKVKRKFFGFLTLHVMKYKDAEIEALKQEYIEGKRAFDEKKHVYERRMRASGIAVLGEHIKYVEENIDYIRSVTNEKMINEFAKTYIDDLDKNNSNGSDFVYAPKANQSNNVTSTNDYSYSHNYNPDGIDDVDGTNGPR